MRLGSPGPPADAHMAPNPTEIVFRLPDAGCRVSPIFLPAFLATQNPSPSRLVSGEILSLECFLAGCLIYRKWLGEGSSQGRLVRRLLLHACGFLGYWKRNQLVAPWWNTRARYRGRWQHRCTVLKCCKSSFFPPVRQTAIAPRLPMPPLPLTGPFTDSNRTLLPRGDTHPSRRAYPPTHRPRRVRIENLFGGLQYASADAEEFQNRLTIEEDDPNAGIFTGRLAGGGTRAGIYGNQ